MEKLFLVIVTLITVSATSVERLESLSVQMGEKISTQKCNQTLENIQVRFASEKPPENCHIPHTSLRKCGPERHPTPNFSFDSFICYQDKMIPCFVEIFEGGKV